MVVRVWRMHLTLESRICPLVYELPPAMVEQGVAQPRPERGGVAAVDET